MPGSVGFPIGFVSLHTGLSTHVIRAWERRYQAVAPQRSETGRRLFTQSDIDRLILLKRVIQNGHSISHIAGLERRDLVELADATTQPRHSTHVELKMPSGIASQETIACCIKAITMLADRHTSRPTLLPGGSGRGRYRKGSRLAAGLFRLQSAG